jgi:hypothetical protein
VAFNPKTVKPRLDLLGGESHSGTLVYSVAYAPLFIYVSHIEAAIIELVVPPIKSKIRIFTCSSRYLFPGFLHVWILNIFILFGEIYLTLPHFLGFQGKRKDHRQHSPL